MSYSISPDGKGGLKSVVSVKDSGVGIPPEKMQLLFKTFSQIDPSLTRNHEGTGLGLAISLSLSRLMGGNAWAESDGDGSTFRSESFALY